MRDSVYQPFENQGHRNFLQRFVEVPVFAWALALPTGGRVLEIGCGRGVALPVFASLLRPSVLIGIDLELAFLEEASRALAGTDCYRLAVGDLRQLPFPDNTFDVVVDFGTCYHVHRGDAALEEIARVLAPGGIFATESKLAQVLAHPIRTRGKRLSIPKGVKLVPRRHAGMWMSFAKQPLAVPGRALTAVWSRRVGRLPDRTARLTPRCAVRPCCSRSSNPSR